MSFLKGNGLNIHKECLLSIESKNLLGSLCALPTNKLSSTQSLRFVESLAFPFPRLLGIPGALGSGGHFPLYSLLPFDSVIAPARSAQLHYLVVI